MRTLNRPMFRMGGPIKEGVMHGIREPHKHGGPTGTGLVGDQRYPKTGDREHHAFFLAPLAAPAAWTAARAAAMRFAPQALRGIKSLFGTTTPGSVTRGAKVGKKAWKKLRKTDPNIGGPFQNVNITPDKFNPNWLGRDPLVKTVGAAGKAIFNPTVGGWAAKGARLATSPSVLAGGAAYAFWPDGTPKTQEELLDSSGIQSKHKGPPGGGDPNMGYVDPDKAKKLAEQRKDDRVNSLLKTMGYDTAKRGAIGKALVDASQIVTERGTLDPKNITRELINPIIAATSKRLEKPEQLNEAVRLMLTKAEIEKEMNPLKDEESRLRIAVAKKTLAGSNFKEAVAAASKDGQLTGSALADRARKYLPGDFKVLNEKVPKKTDTLEYITKIVQDSHTDPEKNPFPPGQYVLKERVIVIDEQGNVTPLDL